jgi:hypothetical protein
MSSYALIKTSLMAALLSLTSAPLALAEMAENCIIDISYSEVKASKSVKHQYKYQAKTKEQCLEYRDLHSIQFTDKIKNKKVSYTYKAAKYRQ